MNQSTRDLTAHFDALGFHYALRNDDENMVMLGITTGKASFSVLALCDEHCVQLLLRLPFRAPAERLAAVMEFFTRANYHLKTGCFELDLADGEMNLRLATFLSGRSLSQDQAGLLVKTALSTADNYHDGLRDVIFKGQEPAPAVAEAELGFRHAVPQGMLVS